MRFTRSFRPVPDSASAARQFAREALTQLGLADHVDRVTLVVGELAVNAILHARTDYLLVLSAPVAGTARVEIHDGHPDKPRRKTSLAPDPLTYGRGLMLIEAAADRWGVDDTSEGKCVWAEVDS